jgi:secreted PhoX family phosphatase
VLDARPEGRHGIPAGNYRGNEFAGACLDARGRMLFVNIQTPGITLCGRRIAQPRLGMRFALSFRARSLPRSARLARGAPPP